MIEINTMIEIAERTIQPHTLTEHVTTSLLHTTQTLNEITKRILELDRASKEKSPKVTDAIGEFVVAHLDKPGELSDIPLSVAIRQEAASWLETELGVWVLQTAKSTIIERQRAQMDELLEGRLITAMRPDRPFNESTSLPVFSKGDLTEVTAPYCAIDPYNAQLLLGGADSYEPKIWEVPLREDWPSGAASIIVH